MVDSDVVVTMFWSVIRILRVPSTICLIIHFYKFFKASTSQSLATRNLTFYCFLLFALYVNSFVMWLEPNQARLPIELDIMIHLMLTTTFHKFIIALDICLCFRQIALYLHPNSGPQNKRFFFYCFSGACIPLIYTFLFVFVFPERGRAYRFGTHVWAIRIIHILRLIPIFGAFWYLRLASMDKNELWRRFSLHIRLLVMLGGFSAALGVSEVLFVKDDECNEIRRARPFDRPYFFAYLFGSILEGSIIGMCFTFKKDTFQTPASMNR